MKGLARFIGKVTLIPERIDVRMEITEVLNGLADELPAVEVVGEASGHADPVRFRQVVRNLVTNAVRYGGSNVGIDISTNAGVIEVAVVDDGDGIPTDHADQIFDAYHRVEESSTTPASVGLGLAVARTLARAMGGDVAYRRAIGGFTVFTLTTPEAQPRSIFDYAFAV